MLNAQSAEVNFSEFAINTCSQKTVGSNFLGKLKIDGNLVVKSKVPPRGGYLALRQLNNIYKQESESFLKKITDERKPAQKNESEE